MKKRYFLFVVSALLLISTVSAQQSAFWGMTTHGGENGYGTIFKTDENGDNQNVIFSFSLQDGCYPQESLLAATDGKLYGMTMGGGANNFGTLFSFDPDNEIYSVLVDFDSVNNGCKPFGSLIQASDGKLYGMTTFGGENGDGVLFEYDIDNQTYTKKLDFNDTICGKNPYGSLMEASDGLLYGMTTFGGPEGGQGVLFSFDFENDSITVLTDFSNAYGFYPYGSLVETSDNMLYGMTAYGGLLGLGTLFRYDPDSNDYTTLLHMTHLTGYHPFGNLIDNGDGKLFGTASAGGYSNGGVIFSFNLSDYSVTVYAGFDGDNGDFPYGSLILASNGKLYGTTLKGGAHDLGVLFEYDLNTFTYTKKLDFDGSGSGSYPQGSLVETDDVTYLSKNISSENCTVYPNPTTGKIFLDLSGVTGMIQVTLINPEGKIIQQTHAWEKSIIELIPGNEKGIYFIMIENGKNKIVRKVVKL